MSPEQISKYTDHGIELVMQYAPKVLLAILTLLIGLRLISLVTKGTAKALAARGVDPTLTPFLNSLIGWTLKSVLIISVASMVGIQTSSFIAIIGAAGLAIGLALQGSLANFAGGVLILIFRPYRVGDVIQAQGEIGAVKEIQIFSTILTNGQNRRLIIPNGAIANGTIVNLTAEPHVRVDLTVGISYDADMKKAREVLTEAVSKVTGVLAEPAPIVKVVELGDSSVNLVVRPFCTPADYWDVHFEATETIKNALDAAGISIPFPQRDIHMISK